MMKYRRLAVLLLFSILFPREGWMSGNPGAFDVAQYYLVSLDSGMWVSIEPPPDCKNPGQYIEQYYEREEAAYARWLKRSRADIDAVFEKAILTRKLPIGKFDENSAWASGIVIEDGVKPERLREDVPEEETSEGIKARILAREGIRDEKKPGLIEFHFTVRGEITRGRAEFRINVLSQIKRTDIDRLQEELSAVLLKHLKDD
jgi:hypothetical protein